MNWPSAFTWFWMIILWVMGIAISKGFWMTLFSLFPPVAWVISMKWIIEIIILKLYNKNKII